MRHAPRLLPGVVAGLALALGACRPGSVEPPRPAALATDAPTGSHRQVVRLGVAVSLSGPGAPIGIMQQRAVQLAVDEINNAHLLGRPQLELALADDASDKERARDLFHHFIESDHVVGIIGPTLSSAALAADPIAQQAGVPVLSISNTAGGITETGSFVFRANLSEAQVIPPTVEAVRSRLRLRRAALLYGDDASTRLTFQSFKKALHDDHIRAVAEVSYAPRATDFAAQLAAIRDTRPDVLFVAAAIGEAPAIVAQAGGLGLGAPIVGGNVFTSAAVRAGAAGAAEGLICGGAWSAANGGARSQAFVKSFADRWNEEPDQYAAQAYAGIYIMAAGLNNAGTVRDPRALRDGLAQVKGLDTVLGSFSFTDDRNADYPAVVQIVRDGRLAPLPPLSLVAPLPETR